MLSLKMGGDVYREKVKEKKRKATVICCKTVQHLTWDLPQEEGEKKMCETAFLMVPEIILGHTDLSSVEFNLGQLLFLLAFILGSLYTWLYSCHAKAVSLLEMQGWYFKNMMVSVS